jgi:hypothetical protein
MFRIIASVGLNVCGVVLIWCAWFLYETETGEIENTLDRWWQDAEALRRRSGSAYAAFMRTVATQTDSLITRLVGSRLISLRFVLVSTCATVAAINLVLQVHDDTLSLQRTGAAMLAFVTIAAASDDLGVHLWPAAAFVLATVSALGYEWFWQYHYQGGPMMSILGVLDFFTFGRFAVTIMEPAVAVLVLSVPCNVVIVAVARWSVRFVATAETLVGVGRLLLISAVVPAAFVVIPVLSPFMTFAPLGSDSHSVTRLAIVYTGYANLYAGSVFAIFLALAMAMLLHRAFWGVVQRPLYALGKKFHVFSQSKMLFSLGIALLGVGHAPVAMVVSAASKSGLF